MSPSSVRKAQTGKASLRAALTVLIVGACLEATADPYYLGDGHHGTLAVLGTGVVINRFATLTQDASTGATTLKVASSGPFSAGDLVMVFRAAGYHPAPDSGVGGPFDLAMAEVGQWELARIGAVASGQLTLTAPLTQRFAADGTQVVLVPEYTDVTVAMDAGLVAAPWNGTTGGVLAFLATGVVHNDGVLSATGAGFRPGNFLNATERASCTNLDEPLAYGAQKGEGMVSTRFGPTHSGRGNVLNAGGGGNCDHSGGGGGGHGGPGGSGGRDWNFADAGGMGGGSLSYALYERMAFGGGGGAGQGHSDAGTRGGAGGGVVFLRAARLEGTGRIEARGESAAHATIDGAGGGGAGGTVHLRLAEQASCSLLDASGGPGGNASARHGPGGGGGGGRILLQASAASCPLTAEPGLAGTGANVPDPHFGALPHPSDLGPFRGQVEVVTERFVGTPSDGGPTEKPGSPWDGGTAVQQVSPRQYTVGCGCQTPLAPEAPWFWILLAATLGAARIRPHV